MINAIIDKITDDINFNSNQTVCYLNIYNYKILRNKPDLIKHIDVFTLDGIMLVLLLRIVTKKKAKRQSPDFSSYFKNLFVFLNDNKKKTYFVGASKEDLNKFVEIIQTNYSDIEIVGYINGFGLDVQNTINDILVKQPGIVIVGLGTPNQEEFVVKLKSEGFKGSSFVCGAFFSQTAINGTTYYPNVINKLHLRWMYRIYKEPKLLQRYLFEYPKGLLCVVNDRFRTSPKL